jgi:hypothetical protein
VVVRLRGSCHRWEQGAAPGPGVEPVVLDEPAPADDTEGHAVRVKATDEADDTEGHGRFSP